MYVLTEVYEHLAVALPHVLRHGEDAGHIVVQERVLLLHKERISAHMAALLMWVFIILLRDHLRVFPASLLLA